MKIFVTSTGTECGKTFITSGLITHRRAAGHHVKALKPVQSGSADDDLHADAALLLQACGQEMNCTSLDAIAPWRFRAPLAPPLAAQIEQRKIDFEAVVDFCRSHIKSAQDDLLIEGAGGIMAPLTMAAHNLDLAAQLGLPLVLIGGSYLGAVSHILTALEVINHKGLICAAIVINETENSSVSLDDSCALARAFCGPIAILSCPRLATSSDPFFASLAHLCDLAPSALRDVP